MLREDPELARRLRAVRERLKVLKEGTPEFEAFRRELKDLVRGARAGD